MNASNYLLKVVLLLAQLGVSHVAVSHVAASIRTEFQCIQCLIHPQNQQRPEGNI